MVDTPVLNADYQTTSDCAICCDKIGFAKTVTKCGHSFCTECILNCVAKNTGTAEGNTRNLCPICRDRMCDEIETDVRTTSITDHWRNEAELWEGQYTVLNSIVDERIEGCKAQHRADMEDQSRLVTSQRATIKNLWTRLQSMRVAEMLEYSAPSRAHPSSQAPMSLNRCGRCRGQGHNVRTCSAAPQRYGRSDATSQIAAGND